MARASASDGAAAKEKAKKPAAKAAAKSTAKRHAAPAQTSFRPTEGANRDPFKLPPPPEEVSGNQNEILGPLPPGSRGLIIEQLKLEGIVLLGKNNPKMIAVLANPANRAYFLHVNDPLYNGVITKITPDSVYFNEDVKDAEGKTTSHEVIKKLAPASGEKK
ncbi:MAG TPA: hypothetical protein VKV95_13065 [Terriglobia bacterium]|nr:hypothetical protein [Terriglobia bacterium]